MPEKNITLPQQVIEFSKSIMGKKIITGVVIGLFIGLSDWLKLPIPTEIVGPLKVTLSAIITAIATDLMGWAGFKNLVKEHNPELE